MEGRLQRILAFVSIFFISNVATAYLMTEIRFCRLSDRACMTMQIPKDVPADTWTKSVLDAAGIDDRGSIVDADGESRPS